MQLSLPVPTTAAPDILLPGLTTVPGGSPRPATDEEGEMISFEALLNPVEPTAEDKPLATTGTDTEQAALLAAALLMAPAAPTPPQPELTVQTPEEEGTDCAREDTSQPFADKQPWAATTSRAATPNLPPFTVASSVRAYVSERPMSAQPPLAGEQEATEGTRIANVTGSARAGAGELRTLVRPLPAETNAEMRALEISAPSTENSSPSTADRDLSTDRLAGMPARRENLPSSPAPLSTVPGPTASTAPGAAVATADQLPATPATRGTIIATEDPGTDASPRGSVAELSGREAVPSGETSPVHSVWMPRAPGPELARRDREWMPLRSVTPEAPATEMEAAAVEPPVVVVASPAAAAARPPSVAAMAISAGRASIDIPVQGAPEHRTRRPASTEKFARPAGEVGFRPSVRENDFQKQFLSPLLQQDTNGLAVVGIDVAKDTTTMPTLATPRPPTVHVAESGALMASSSWAAAPDSGAPIMNLEKMVPAAAVRETMTAVLHAVEALASRSDKAQSAVHLDFQVGAEKLGLHLALREGTVYTIFRTDSADLRTALGQEWQAVVPAMIARDGQIAAPVFAPAAPNGTGSTDSASGSLGQGHPQQRGGQPAPETHFFSPGRTPGTHAGAPASATPAPGPVVSTSLLNAFA